MKTFITRSRRLRGTPFISRLEKQGVKSFTVYNHMLLPTTFSSPEEEYNHLKEHVQIWDVSVQREIEIEGNDSGKLVQLMTCRNLTNSKIGSCYYAPLVDSNGGIVNDPLIYKLEENRWRICIADSDVLLFAKGIASVKNFKVNKKYFRPTEVHNLLGDPSKAVKKLNWNPRKTDFQKLVKEMVESDIKNVKIAMGTFQDFDERNINEIEHLKE